MPDNFFDVTKIIELLPWNIYWCDRNGVYLGCNQITLDEMHLTREEFVGKTLREMGINERFAQSVVEMDQEIMASGEPYTFEQNYANPSKGPQIFLTQKVPIKNKAGEVVGLAGISVNITEQKRTEARLKIAKEEAEKANLAKTEFVLNLSHDVRSPLIGIMGVAEHLRNEEPDETKRKQLQSLVDSSRQLEKFISGILEEVTSSEAQLRKEKVDFRNLLNEVGNIVAPIAEQKKNIILLVDYPENLPTFLISDASALKKIFLNLLANAVKFTHQGTVLVRVEKEFALGRDFLVVHVVDTGVGIPEDKQSFVFEKFVRITQTTGDGKYKGFGLGLWATKNLVDKLGGMIKLSSCFGKGSTFTVYLPL